MFSYALIASVCNVGVALLCCLVLLFEVTVFYCQCFSFAVSGITTVVLLNITTLLFFGLLSILCFACKVIFLFLGLLCVVLFLLLLSFLLVLPAFIVISYLQLYVLLILYYCCV